MKVDFRIKTSGFRCLFWLGAINAVFSTVTYLGAQIIENPSKPQAANAGRVVTPKEVLAIEDTGDNFFFKYPLQPKIGPDGSIYVIDENQFLVFDPAGKFVRNLFKKGQGPGELIDAGDYEFDGDQVVISQGQPAKLVWFDKNGKLVKNATLSPKYGFLMFLGKSKNLWIFCTSDISQDVNGIKFVDQPYQLLSWNESANTWRPLSAFAVRVFSAFEGGSGSIFRVGNFLTRLFSDQYFAVCHTPEYLIKIFDLESDKVVRQFRRNYTRIPPRPLKPGQQRPRYSLNGKIFDVPADKYANDIANMFVRDNRLWVVTSTTEKKKGVLIDVFDKEGDFLDSFYISLPESGLEAIRSSYRCTLTGDALLTIERTEEGTYAIKKYIIAE